MRAYSTREPTYLVSLGLLDRDECSGKWCLHKFIIGINKALDLSTVIKVNHKGYFELSVKQGIRLACFIDIGKW